MSLKSIELVNFRTYPLANFDINEGLTVIEGPNGVGKTNLLEAVYLLGGGKSWRAKDKDLVAREQDFYRVRGEIASSSLELRYSPARGKELLVAGKARKRQAHQMLPIVLFEPQSLDILLGSPVVRRRWLNRLLAMADLRYRETIHLYHHLLHQRNSLLKQSGLSEARAQVFAWDLPLSESAQYINNERQQFIKYLASKLPATYNQISSKAADISIEYRAHPNGEDYATLLLEQLDKSLPTDVRFGFTSAGPHRDDVRFYINGRPVNQTASRGELRTLILALKFIEYDFLKKITRKLPLLLLDDVFSELDAERRQFLSEQIANIQTILTTTETKGLKPSLPAGFTHIKLKRRAR